MDFGGSDTPTPPPVAEPIDIIDEISGYEQVKVTGADGKTRFVRRALPLSPEQEALKLQYENIVKEQIGIIEELSAPELASQIPEFQPALQAYKEQQQISLGKAVRARSRSEEETLARRGVESSTGATEQRAILGRDIQASEQQIDRDTMLFGEQLRNQAIGRSQNLLGLATGRQDIAFNQGLQSLGQLMSTQQAQLGAQQNYNNMLFQSQMQSAANKQSGFNALLNAGATVAGAAFGGPLGSAIAGGVTKMLTSGGTGSDAFSAGTQSTITPSGVRLPAGLPRSIG